MNKSEYKQLYKKYEKPPSTLFHKFFSKKLAEFFTFYFLRLNLTPNVLSMLTLIFILIGILSLNIINGILGKIIFLICLQFSYVIDCSDGVVARISNKSASFGAYLDITLDRLNIFLVFLGLGIYLNSVEPFNEFSLILFILSSMFYFHYQIMALLRKHYFSELDGFMKSNTSNSYLRKVVRLIYEFIDTGIFFFILSLSVFMNFVLEIVIFYGFIGFMLSTAMYIFLYKTSKYENRS